MSERDGNPSQPQLSVVLSTLGNYDTLTLVLDGYGRQDAPPGSFEVVVVMDSADPEPDSVMRAIGERAYPIRRVTGRAPGLSANRNTGIAESRAPIILFTDNDTIPVRSFISEHLAWHARHPEEEIGILGLMRWARGMKVTTFMRWLDTGIHFDYSNIKGVDAGWGRFAGGNISLKRSFIQKVGEFDNEHFPYLYEDTDWAYRASKLGLKVLFNRKAVVDHLRPTTLAMWKKRAQRIALAESWFVRLHPEVKPWFYTMFTAVTDHPPARGRGIKLAPYVGRNVPWLGPRVWKSVDTYYKQQLAPYFLDAWKEAERSGALSKPPDLSELAVE